MRRMGTAGIQHTTDTDATIQFGVEAIFRRTIPLGEFKAQIWEIEFTWHFWTFWQRLFIWPGKRKQR